MVIVTHVRGITHRGNITLIAIMLLYQQQFVSSDVMLGCCKSWYHTHIRRITYITNKKPQYFQLSPC